MIHPRFALAATLLLAVAPISVAAAPDPDAATPATRAANAAALADAPLGDTRDEAFAARGFVATRKDPLIRDADGAVVWNLDAFRFLAGKAPDTVNPSLWRHAGLLARHGLFKVTDRIWQVRGFDVSNLTFVRGDKGWIVIDTGTTVETARAAWDLVIERLGKAPVTAVIYTHSHVDHFGGTAAFTADLAPGAPIVAPKGFREAAISENVIAGPAMARRASYQFGIPLGKGPTQSLGSGIGVGTPVGTQTLVPPTQEVDATGTVLVLDGVKILFQFTPGTEAPAEMNLGFPDWKVVDMAENANVTQHNILTPRGAVIRNARAWAQGLTEAIDVFAGSDTQITSHGWPRFGAGEITDYLGKHRDAYAYLHDQTVRLMNKGLTGPEIAARLKLPPALQKEWYDRPYYGSLSFNARAVYQYYLGWYDANPVHLAPLPPEDGGKRYVEALGGAARVRALAQAAFDKGDYAWAAELLDKAVFADPADQEARALLARCYRQMAWSSENAIWRNMYLTGAQELVGGVKPIEAAGRSTLAASLPPTDLFDVLATRLDPEKVGSGAVRLGFTFPDRAVSYTLVVANGVLTHRPGLVGTPDARLTVKYPDLAAALLRGQPLAAKVAAGEASIAGDPAAFGRLTAWLDKPEPLFPIVTP
ncbi:MBL fold metallo-hydrolase [Novosphingobium sp. KCTC 2891]|uniref:alkyl/aryl-sulfatase n=1 Tax=Novosphingobium sp. KCTC 2891 TaxID=2989730 RepID=UPI002223BF95|nr:alkyl sulfatase dimerization domain-containing protein [Novosphingobium sp. KCTC 2891]MCW1381612.1 MBL fold metallo-hydrolase [Novosphingobium sp. KCTC 2891]